MKTGLKIIYIFLLISLSGTSAGADPLKSIAKKMAKKIENLPNKKIAVLNFPYHNGYISSGSSIVQERLTTFLTETGKVEVVERNLLDKILGEMSLEISGIIDEKMTKKLGKVLGVSALVTGTLNDFKSKKTEVNARIIHIQTGKILAAGRAEIKRTWSDSPVKPSDSSSTLPDEIVPPKKQEVFSDEPLIQLAILLDTSGSMQGLIHQARTQLWKIVNELSSFEKEGDNPIIQVALYEYGNSRISHDENYLRQILPFTTDLDMVSEKLFLLTTSGGQEYCGAVIMDAVNGLAWDKHTDVYKVVFIAGNEPFTQGPIDFRKAVGEAVSNDIFLNTIFCGNIQQGIATKWKAGADMGNGEYLNIVQEAEVVAVQAPQDAEIRRLGNQLNHTFIFYGDKGRKSAIKQEAQDKKAAEYALAGVSTERALFKAKAQYSRGTAGDLVNEVSEGRVKIEEIKKEDLPDALKNMKEEEIREYVNKKSRERKEIQNKINELNKQRRIYIEKKAKEMVTKNGKKTLDQVILNTIRSQAVKKNFNLNN